MKGDAIELFMWGFQRHFRMEVQSGVTASLSHLGAPVEPEVYLVGLLKPGGAGHSICIEPEDGLVLPADFRDLDARRAELYELDPDSKVIRSDRRHHEQSQQRNLDRATGTAIAEVLERKVGEGLRFFVALPTMVEEHYVYTAVGLPESLIAQTPQLAGTSAPERYPVTRSLVEGAVNELLRTSTKALFAPDPGSNFGVGIVPADVARNAGRALLNGAVTLAGNIYGPPLYDALNSVSTTRYEQRLGLGRFVIASPSSEHVERTLNLKVPIRVHETRALRKMLEVSGNRRASLLTDGASVYGLGNVRETYDPASESVFEVLVVGHGSWDLRHAENTLVSVQNGAPHLPERRLSRDRFDDIAQRVFAASGGGYDLDALWELAMGAADAEHGTMLVVSSQAAAEARRLGDQSLAVEPAQLDGELVRQVTTIDGAVLVGPDAMCHAIGVILDGTSGAGGDRSRGARFNSAVRYLGSAAAPTMIILVSEDGMINVLPDLRPRIRRSDLARLIEDVREAAGLDPVDPERFYKAYNRTEAAAFYLSADQCAELNTLRREHWERRKAAGAQIWIDERDLTPHPQMSDEYLIE